MTIGPLRVRLVWVLLVLALLGMVGGLFALRDVAQRINAAGDRTPAPETRRLPTSRFSSAFSPGPRMGDLHDLLSGVEPTRAENEDEDEQDEPSPPTSAELTPAPEPEPEPEPPPQIDRDGPRRTPRTPRTPQSAR